MTVIAALVHDGVVYMGGDSAGVSGWDLTIRADEKVFLKGSYLFGFTSSYRMGQLIRYSLKLPDPPVINLDEFMATTFIDALRDVLKDNGWAKKEADREQGGTFLVGIRDQIYMVEGDYQVGRSVDDFAACGAGAPVSLGSLYATARQNPRKRILTAMKAAERFNVAVCGPFVIATTEGA